MKNAERVIEVDEVEGRIGTRNRQTLEADDPETRALAGSKALHQDLEHPDGLGDRVDNGDSRAKVHLAKLVVRTQYPGVHSTSPPNQSSTVERKPPVSVGRSFSLRQRQRQGRTGLAGTQEYRGNQRVHGPDAGKIGSPQGSQDGMSRKGTFATHSKIEEQGELAESAFRG